MLDDSTAVVRQRDALNRLFMLAKTAPKDSMPDLSWQIGVMERAYYVTGAHMARMIDERLGRDALVATIKTGPLDFVDTYNALVAADERVCTFDRPAGEDFLGRLKAAAGAGDRASFDAIAARMAAAPTDLPPQTRRQLERYGCGMLTQEAHDWAIAIFELDVALFPDEPKAYDRLAEAHLKAGDEAQAGHWYRRALEIDPDWENARTMLGQLE